MNQSDINQITDLLQNAMKRKDWACVEEAFEYICEFSDEGCIFYEE